MKGRILGAKNWIVTAVGAVAGALVFAGQYLEMIPPEYRSNKWYGIAAALDAIGGYLKWPSGKPVVVPATPPTQEK